MSWIRSGVSKAVDVGGKNKLTLTRSVCNYANSVSQQAGQAVATTISAEKDILVCEISDKRRVSVSSWSGKVLLDIREYYEKDGKKLPSKKGITLTRDQWKILRDHVDQIDKALAEYS